MKLNLSQSKGMTATAVMMLVDEGKISLDGLPLAVGDDWFGHGGAEATNMEIRPANGIVTIWLVQHGGFAGEGGKAQGVFKNWAKQRFGK